MKPQMAGITVVAIWCAVCGSELAKQEVAHLSAQMTELSSKHAASLQALSASQREVATHSSRVEALIAENGDLKSSLANALHGVTLMALQSSSPMGAWCSPIHFHAASRTRSHSIALSRSLCIRLPVWLALFLLCLVFPFFFVLFWRVSLSCESSGS